MSEDNPFIDAHKDVDSSNNIGKPSVTVDWGVNQQKTGYKLRRDNVFIHLHKRRGHICVEPKAINFVEVEGKLDSKTKECLAFLKEQDVDVR